VEERRPHDKTNYGKWGHTSVTRAEFKLAIPDAVAVIALFSQQYDIMKRVNSTRQIGVTCVTLLDLKTR